METEYIGGLPVDNLTYQQIDEDLLKYLAANKKMVITSVNPQITLQAMENPAVKQYIERASHRIADGIGVVKMSKLLGGHITERITGIEVMQHCLEFANTYGYRIFLYGAKKEVVNQAAANIQKKYPNILVAGTLHGYTSRDNEAIVKKINETHPTFLFVALGSPKQELFLEHNFEQLDAKVLLDVGGTFDVLAGAVKRAPKFYLNNNLEWLYRSLSMKRYDRLVQIPKYVHMAFKQRKAVHATHKKTEAQQVTSHVQDLKKMDNWHNQ